MQKYIKIFIRWIKMLSGKSVFHKVQISGLFWEKDNVRGYYSDLRHKVIYNNRLDSLGVPLNTTSEGKQFYFSITIFQYGLGAYDLYLETGDKQYKEKFFNAVKWCIENQMDHGQWDAFGWCKDTHSFSSMAQGEGVSLLCRAFVETKERKYLEAAKRAIDFMLVEQKRGGTACYDNEGYLISLEEKTDVKTIMNGMVFSVWGLYDYLLCVPNDFHRKKMLQAVGSLEKLLPQFDRGYWSNYDLDGHIASPFYHLLHIEQLKVLSELFDSKEFEKYQIIFEKYNASWMKRKVAFIIKVAQKIKRIRTDAVIIE